MQPHAAPRRSVRNPMSFIHFVRHRPSAQKPPERSHASSRASLWQEDMKTLIKQLWAISPQAMSASVLAFAMTNATAASDSSDTHEYLVSAVLRQGGEGLVIRLVHAVMAGRSEEEASGVFLKKARAQFEGYSVMEVLATPVKASSPTCRRSEFTHTSF